MNTVEDKLRAFLKIIYDEIKEDREKKIEIFEKDKEKKIIEYEKKIKNKKKVFINKIEKEANIKFGEIISRGKIEYMHSIFEFKENLINNTMNILKKELENLCNSYHYKEFLFQQLIDNFKQLMSGKYIIYLNKRDFDKFKKDLEKEIDSFSDKYGQFEITYKNILGGFIIEDIERTFRIDNTLNNKINKNKESIGMKIIEGILSKR